MKKGFSLPVWVAASAKSAVKKLLGFKFENYEFIKIPNNNKGVKIKVHSSGLLNKNLSSLGITFVNSELDLDLTQNLEIWTLASLQKIQSKEKTKPDLINLIPGYGVGVYSKTSEICISSFAKNLLNENLLELIPEGFQLNLEIIFPNGKFLSERTSNKSFGIVEGLSIIGTSAETYSSASPDQLDNAKSEIDMIVTKNFNGIITFVIGENGLDLAKNEKISSPIIKIGNWIGPLLVYAAAKNIKQVLLLGYHGKLIKLAAGIFHTHNHLADARIEILVYFAFLEKLPSELIDRFYLCDTVEDCLVLVEKFNIETANKLWAKIANKIEIRSSEYVKRYLSSELKIGAAMFDRQREIRWIGINGQSMFSKKNNF